MYNLHLSAEQLEIRDTVRDFVAREIKPVALKSERLEAFERPLLIDLIDKASQMGLRTLALSEGLGGAGADSLTCCLVTEELALGDPDMAAVLAQTSAISRLLFDRLMTPEQRDRFLPPFLESDRYHFAYADHEPETDTSLGVNYQRPMTNEPVIKTIAVRADSHWIVNGIKNCVANAALAKLFVVKVSTPDQHGVTTLLVPRDTPGLTVREHSGAGRWYHGTCGEVTFKNCPVLAQNLLGAGGQELLTAGLGFEFPQFQALSLGIARAAYEAALDYAQLRVQGGRRIIEHQAIGTKLAEIAIKLDAARNTVWKAAWATDHPEAIADGSLADLPFQAMAKVFTSEAALQAVKDAAECFGAMGVMRDMPLQKYVHDARICLHSGNGNDDAKLRIAEALTGYRRSAASREKILEAVGV